ncbi:MAG: tyrosine-type recombinase/integrase, partial [Betaproteobacteria bacterium]
MMGLMMGVSGMPKVAKERSALEVKRLTQPGLHFVGLVPGLALQVLPSGGRTWVLRTMIGSRRRDMGLGGFPEVTLADARARAREAREKIRQGIDPIAQAQAARDGLKNAVRMTFSQAAEKFIDAHRAGWRNEKSAQQWTSSIEHYAFPFIGSQDVAQVGIAHVLQVLEQPVPTKRSAKDMNGKLWTHRPETAQRLRGRIENILDWAKGRGLRSGDNPAAWKGCLDAQLPRLEKSKRVVHHRAMALEDIASFMA